MAGPLLEYLSLVYEGASDFFLEPLGDTVLLSVLEKNVGYVPVTRLSDGTLRYLCLLAILLAPEPPPLLVIDEPDLGLHPDLMPTLAKLLVSASERTQVLVTTHSRLLIDALSDDPASVIVCERADGASRMERLNADDLRVWLEQYSLGSLWSMGQIGGNRW
jgi:predicted ATPase